MDNTEETVKEKTRAYMAGIIDAEGCIRLARYRKNGIMVYSPRVYVSNQSRRLMKWIVHHFGGQFTRNTNSNAGKDWYLWYCSSKKFMVDFLPSIVPYLKLKKSQAVALIQWCSGDDIWTPEGLFEFLKQEKINGSVTTEMHNGYIKADQAYLAGFFDGEGCIRINKTPTRNTISYHLVVSVTNKNQEILKAHLSMYGGLLRHKANQVYDWILSDKRQIEKFLLYTNPYLVIKSDEAKIGLEYIRIGRRVNPGKREQLYVLMKSLKDRRYSLNCSETSSMTVAEATCSN